MTRYRMVLECGHTQRTDAQVAAGTQRICREGDCAATTDGESRRKVVDQHQEEPDREMSSAAMEAGDSFTAAGRMVMRQYLLSIPEELRLKIGRLVLRTLLVEMEEMPETLVEER